MFLSCFYGGWAHWGSNDGSATDLKDPFPVCGSFSTLLKGERSHITVTWEAKNWKIQRTHECFVYLSLTLFLAVKIETPGYGHPGSPFEYDYCLCVYHFL